MIRTNNRVALYARFSSDNQRSESIDAQIRAMQAYCVQHNYVIVETYIDEAKSATTDHRPSFQRAIADSKNGSFDILLVHKLDRFARNRYDSAVYKRELKKNGVQVYSVLENLDDSPESIMMEAVLEGMAEYYSINLKREVLKGMRENAIKCTHTGGKPGLGFEVHPVTKKLIVNEKEAEAVRIIFSMYASGSGYTEIIDRLNREGYLTKKGVPFRKNSIHDILTNMKYKGTYVYNRAAAKAADGTRNNHCSKAFDDYIIIEGGCPRIVDDDTFDKVQKRLIANKNCGMRDKGKHRYLLSGKVFCRDCGKSMVGNSVHSGRNKTLYVTYKCPQKRRYCENKEINRDYLESYVVSLLEKEIFSATAMKRIIQRIEATQNGSTESLQERHQELTEALATTEQALANVADAVAGGLLSDALTTKLRELEAEKERITSSLGALDSPAKPTIHIDGQMIRERYRELKRTPASPEYKEFVQSFIDKIIVGRYMVEITVKTGLDVCPELDTTFSVKRQVIYEERKKMA